MEPQNKRIIPINIEEEMKSSYIDYSMSVIVSRALPDVRDGLKPVHRRVLYGMHELGLTAGTNYKKSARIVGEVLGKYHPHGDSSVYDTLVRMAQEFSMRYPLVDGQGNFGSVDGDSAAAMRYTEARMTKIAEEMLADIGKETVDTQENFDGTLDEPIVLPAAFPNMLVNGSDGIAVGMATKIPPHNLGEAIDAVVAYIDDPEIDIDGLMEHCPAPDFPTGGIIYGYAGVHEAYHTGRGRVIMRAKMHEEEIRKGRMALVITEIPYQVNKSAEIERIADRVRQDRIEEYLNLAAAAGLIDRPLYFRGTARVTGAATKIQAGEYAIETTTTPYRLLNKFVAGDVKNYSLTIIEGWTFEDRPELADEAGLLLDIYEGNVDAIQFVKLPVDVR